MNDDRKSDGQPNRQYPLIKFDPNHVPPELHPLIPYAQKWGIRQSEELVKRVEEATAEELKELDDGVTPFLEPLKTFAFGPTVNPESFIFDALHNAKRMAWPKLVIWSKQDDNPKINPDHVPPELHPLIPYAEKWGIPNRRTQNKRLHDAPVEEALEMYAILYPVRNEVWHFVESDLPREHPTSYAVAVFACLQDLMSVAADILVDNVPESWLKIVGWPERFPVIPYDPAKLPLELQPLVPFIDKWVRNDDYLRSLAIRIATKREQDELLSICDQIGEDVIRSLELEMFNENDRTHEWEGYVIAQLMELVDEIRWQRR